MFGCAGVFLVRVLQKQRMTRPYGRTPSNLTSPLDQHLAKPCKNIARSACMGRRHACARHKSCVCMLVFAIKQAKSTYTDDKRSQTSEPLRKLFCSMQRPTRPYGRVSWFPSLCKIPMKQCRNCIVFLCLSNFGQTNESPSVNACI